MHTSPPSPTSISAAGIRQGDEQHQHQQHDVEAKQEQPQQRLSVTRRALEFAWFLIKDQWFLVGIAIVTVIASQVQVPMHQQDVKQVVVSYLSGEFFSLSMNGLGWAGGARNVTHTKGTEN